MAMSGFAAVWNTDGAPVDERLLVRMESLLSSRGPDEQRIVILGARKNLGLVHAAFHTTEESKQEHQPCTMDGSAWLTGHIRIDGREQLSRDLRAHNLGQVASADAQMVLQAYRVWGHKFIERIIGDYSFVIWNDKEQRLLVARDHLGTRPLFYAKAGKSWIVSNTLDCVRLHADVSGELDDSYIFDFLANVRRADFERTVYREIKRLPPGCILDLTSSGGSIRKYWQLEVGEPIYYKRREEYLEHFRELAKTTIRDRFRSGKAGIGMSGGLDSSTITAFLLQLAGNREKDIIINSTYFDKLIYDDERRYATAVADHFGVSINFENQDSAVYDAQWWMRSFVPPEPTEGVLSRFAALNPTQPDVFSKVRVLFVGHGPDEALQNNDWKPYARWLLKKRHFVKLGAALGFKLRARSLSGILSSFRRGPRSEEALPVSALPAWLRNDMIGHREPSHSVQSEKNISYRPHPWHPIAVETFCTPLWQDYFDSFDPGFGGRLIEAVHPYLDVRMLGFLLSLPVVPWCHGKLLLRESMRGLLPDLVLARKKTTLSGDPWVKAMVQHPFPRISNSPELSRYVDISKLPGQWAQDVYQNRLIRRLLGLQYWLSARPGAVWRREMAKDLASAL
jgi:asparagine synthase (glutamine-hydrolysing)